MSYKLRVLNDSPLGFWELNSQNPATYNDAVINYNDTNSLYNQSLEDYFPDITPNLNSATDPAFSQTTSIDILPLITNTSCINPVNSVRSDCNTEPLPCCQNRRR